METPTFENPPVCRSFLWYNIRICPFDENVYVPLLWYTSKIVYGAAAVGVRGVRCGGEVKKLLCKCEVSVLCFCYDYLSAVRTEEAFSRFCLCLIVIFVFIS